MFAQATAVAEAKARADYLSQKATRGRRKGPSKKGQALTFGQQKTQLRFAPPSHHDDYYPGATN